MGFDGSAIMMEKCKKIIYKIVKNIKLEEEEKDLVDKIVRDKEKKFRGEL